MKKPPSEYYSLDEIASQWKYTINDLLHYGKMGQLQICVVLEGTLVEKRKSRPINKKDPLFKIIQGNSAKPVYLMESTGTDNIVGVYPLSEENVLRIGRGKPIEDVEDFNDDCISYRFGFMLELLDDSLNFQPIERKIEITDLVITHKEKLRFEVACDMAAGNDIGEKERCTWLKIIYLLIHKLAASQANLKKGQGNINISALEQTLKNEAEKHNLELTKLSNDTLGNIYKEALNVLEPDYTFKE